MSTDARTAPPFAGCCDRCWHAPGRPCPDLVDCLAHGPVCHHSDGCRARLAERMGEEPSAPPAPSFGGWAPPVAPEPRQPPAS